MSVKMKSSLLIIHEGHLVISFVKVQYFLNNDIEDSEGHERRIKSLAIVPPQQPTTFL